MRNAVKIIAGLVLCPVVAALLTISLRDGDPIRLVAPAICLQVIVVTAFFVGRIPALVGSVLSSLTFAIWLFPPYGRLWVHDPTERIVLTLFQLVALGVALISPRRRSAIELTAERLDSTATLAHGNNSQSPFAQSSQSGRSTSR